MQFLTNITSNLLMHNYNELTYSQLHVLVMLEVGRQNNYLSTSRIYIKYVFLNIFDPFLFCFYYQKDY